MYRVGIEDGGDTAWQFLFGVYTNSLDAAEQPRVLHALTRSTNATQLSLMLSMCGTPAVIKQQDQARVILHISQNSIGNALAWAWVQEHWALIFARFGAASFGLGELVAGVVGTIQTPSELQQVQEFFFSNGTDIVSPCWE